MGRPMMLTSVLCLIVWACSTNGGTQPDLPSEELSIPSTEATASPVTNIPIPTTDTEQLSQEELELLMVLDVEDCTADQAVGSVINNSNLTVDLTVEIQLLDETGALLNTGFGVVEALQAGDTGDWTAALPTGDYNMCFALISSVEETP